MGIIPGGTALITGSASGIGRATAQKFAEHGAASLVLCDINEVGLAESKELVQAQYPKVDILTLRMDVANESSIIAAHRRAIDRFGQINYAVNNAGTPGVMKPSTESTVDEFRFGIDINLFGVWIGQREQLKQMVTQAADERGNRGSIVNISSIYGHTCGKNTTSYCAAKHAVIGLTRSDGANYAKQGIRVNAVCPGYTDTPMLQMPGAGRAVGMDEYIATCPKGELGRPEDIANAIVFFSSPMASYVTGQNLAVDGGFLVV